jgi:hypothetical protein
VNLKIEGKGDNNEHLVVFRSADAPTILVIKKIHIEFQLFDAINFE